MSNNITKQNKIDIQNINDSFEKATSKIVLCNGCTKCCENGIVYTLPEEEERLTKIGVKLFEIDGVKFIQRNNDGSCSMLDKTNKKCSIYADRPMCCRAFPLDIFSRNGKLEWAIYNYCPEERIITINKKNNEAELNTEILSYITDSIENNLNENVIRFLETEDKVVAKVEYLDEYSDDYLIIGPVIKKVS